MGESQDSAGNANPILNIRGQKVALGPLERSLLPEYRRWINDFDTLRTLGAPPGPMTAEQEESWYEGRTKAEGEIHFTIYTLPDLVPVGNTGLHNVDHRNRSAAFGIVIGETEYRGCGLGTETASLMLDYAFTALGLHNVLLSVYEFNEAGRRAYEKAGFREIGRRRECRVMGGRVWDELLMDCLSPEFESPVLADTFRPS